MNLPDDCVDTSDYEKHFDAEEYIKVFYGTIDGAVEVPGFNLFIQNGMHQAFSKGDIAGKSLLDIGTGPVVRSIISASKYFDEITLSDFTSGNREVLTKWWRGGLSYMAGFFQDFVQREGNGESWVDREAQVRGKVKNILKCDVLKANPLDPCVLESQDAIITSLCLNGASSTISDYKQAVSNVKSLLKTMGHLVVVGVINDTFYKVGKFRFPSLKLSREETQKTYLEAGFGIISWNEMGQTVPPKADAPPALADLENLFVMVAVKLP